MPRFDFGRYLPPPLVGVAVLLVALILLTPNLLPNAQPSAGSIFTQAELVIDWDSVHNVTHIYVRGLGTVRYTSIHIGLSKEYNWSNPPALGNLSLNWTNQSAVVASQSVTASNPVAVSAAALYTDPFGTRVEYGGIYAFWVQSTTLVTRTLLSGETAAPFTPLADLPLTLLLVPVPIGAVS